VGVDLLFTHIIFFKIALIYILIIVGIPAATAATAIAIAIHLAGFCRNFYLRRFEV
jgi:hypothetical protein